MHMRTDSIRASAAAAIAIGHAVHTSDIADLQDHAAQPVAIEKHGHGGTDLRQGCHPLVQLKQRGH